MKKGKAGDIFKIPLTEDEYAFGRLMLDVRAQCIETGKIANDNPLMIFPDALLIEIYRNTSAGQLPSNLEVLIPGLFSSNHCLRDGSWEIIDHKDVDPRELEFPESLSAGETSGAMLVRGETRQPVPMDMNEIMDIGIYPTMHPCRVLQELILFHLGRKDEIENREPDEVEYYELTNYDLRYYPERNRILTSGGIDPDEKYYELATRLGHDPGRFYIQKS